MRLVSTMITAVVPGVFDRVLEELVFLRLTADGCCFAQEAFTYAICLQLCHFNYNNDIHATAMTSQRA